MFTKHSHRLFTKSIIINLSFPPHYNIVNVKSMDKVKSKENESIILSLSKIKN